MKLTKAAFAKLSPDAQEAQVLLYARDRFKQAEGAGGLDDPFVTPLQIRRKFGADAWQVVERLLAKRELLDASEDGQAMVIHRKGARIPEMRGQKQITVINDKTTPAEFNHAVREYADHVLEVAEKHHGPGAYDDIEEP